MSTSPADTPLLEFPLEWHGRIITHSSAENIVEALHRTLMTFGINAIPVKNNSSTNGKYTSYTVSITFPDRIMMDKVINELSSTPGVKLVI